MRKQIDVEAALRRKGFRQVDTHHRYFVYHTRSGLKSRIRTKTSHGGRDLDASLLAQMAKQCGVSRNEFLDLVDCPLDQQAYEMKVTASL
ncbi:MAG TPA: type II toxin-antitoxin system HicA family toxin [Longimicrobium sp.]|jgi:predicted RNA binding protein YcfA (HicA-like mRNA interferase family)|uniref:type II toxin-antitoxin system HicA family toxin n=1 Tax=Longimicrobium sp. TaxID=2029185 RepID=UPI002EDB1842